MSHLKDILYKKNTTIEIKIKKKLEKEKETLITHIKLKTNTIDFSNLIKYKSNRVEHEKEHNNEKTQNKTRKTK